MPVVASLSAACAGSARSARIVRLIVAKVGRWPRTNCPCAFRGVPAGAQVRCARRSNRTGQCTCCCKSAVVMTASQKTASSHLQVCVGSLRPRKNICLGFAGLHAEFPLSDCQPIDCQLPSLDVGPPTSHLLLHCLLESLIGLVARRARILACIIVVSPSSSSSNCTFSSSSLFRGSSSSPSHSLSSWSSGLGIVLLVCVRI